jgi:hypothetical protein
MMKGHDPLHFHAKRRREGCCIAQQSPPSCHPKTKDDTATNTQTPKIRSDQHIQNSNFRFKSREKRTRGSERCEKDRTAISSGPNNVHHTLLVVVKTAMLLFLLLLQTVYECMWIVTRCACTVPVRPLVGTLGCF